MEHYSFWSLFPPLLAIILAIKTRQVFVSLLFGIWLGWIILSEEIPEPLCSAHLLVLLLHLFKNPAVWRDLSILLIQDLIN